MTHFPFKPGPFDSDLVHWPVRIGREEIMIEAPPDMLRSTATELVQALLDQSSVSEDDEATSEESMKMALRHGVPGMRFATMTFERDSIRWTVILEQDRATVLPEGEFERFLLRRVRDSRHD